MKKLFTKQLLILVLALLGITLIGCNTSKKEEVIKVYTRDTSSGTRDGFFSGIGFKDAKAKNDPLVSGYVEVESNGQMVSTIKNDKNGLGYISLSSLAASNLKGLTYEGVEPTEAHVIDKTYKLTRNFNYMLRDTYANETNKKLAEAFVAYMGTKEGKATIKSGEGIVDIKDSDPTWDSIKASHPVTALVNTGITLRFGGSTSVEKIAKKLSAEFSVLAGNFKFEHNHTGSSDAFKRTNGSEKDNQNALDIGFASREFKSSESATTKGTLCIDAIVVVVNADNPLVKVSKEQLKDIYSGKITKFSEVK